MGGCTLGGGTLTIDGEFYPFGIAGLGFGGFGASAVESKMRGLALAGGIDGLVIRWDEDEKSTMDEAIGGTEEIVGEGIASLVFSTGCGGVL